jgi:hypothetical protein
VKTNRNPDWPKMLRALEGFLEANGHFRVEERRKHNPTLAGWWLRVRDRLETLTYEQILSLDYLGFFAQLDQRWLDRYAQLQSFKAKMGHCNVPVHWPENRQLGVWVHAQRQKAAKMALWRRKLLTDSGFCFRARRGSLAQWEEFIKRLKRYRKRFGNCNVPGKWSEDRTLASWVSRVRSLRKSLDHDRIKELDSLGFDWNPIDTTWKKRLRELKAFKERHGHCRVSNRAEKLGIWVVRLRHAKESLSPAQIRTLNKIGFDWLPRNTRWRTSYKELLAFRRRFGHVNVPNHWPENRDLATWVTMQRIYKATLSQERIALLKKVGFDWHPHETNWMRRYQELKAYHMKHGRSPAAAESALGTWVANQRQIHTRMKMPPQRKKLLDEIGFVWRVLGHLK